LKPRSAGEPAADPPPPPAPAADEEVRRKVVAAIAKALDLREDQIPLTASLEEELGAESLDFLDLAFILEREFRIRLPRYNLLERAEARYGQGALVQDGVVTERGLELLRLRMPEVDARRLAPGLRAAELGRLVTAETFVRVVGELLAHKAEMLAAPCAACGGPLTASPLAPELLCAGCGTSLPLAAGDDLLL
jgi:acyl carrier protein